MTLLFLAQAVLVLVLRRTEGSYLIKDITINETAVINCSLGEIIQINWALYGNRYVNPLGCETNVTTIVSQHCNDHQLCHIRVDDSFFNTTCAGILFLFLFFFIFKHEPS